MRILEVVGLTKRFAGRAALDALSFTAEEGGAVGLFGPAGAGKTTCLHCLSGFVAPDAGRVIFDGRDVTGLPPHRLARAGIAWTFQTARPFRHLSAVENVMLAVAHGLAQGVAALLGVWRGRRVRARALELLERVALSPDADTKAGLLPVSRLKRLEVARALALEPRLILLDEPLGGLPTEELSSWPPARPRACARTRGWSRSTRTPVRCPPISESAPLRPLRAAGPAEGRPQEDARPQDPEERRPPVRVLRLAPRANAHGP
jgi:branched-chain amino acid transport system ATP-binding protein